MHEGALGVHEVELVVQAGPGLGDGSGVAQHAHGPLHLGQVPPRDHRGGLVVDAHLPEKENMVNSECGLGNGSLYFKMGAVDPL